MESKRPETRVPSRRAALLGLLATLVLLTGCAKSDDPAYYIERLGSEKEQERTRAVQELGRMREKAMPAIREALDHEAPAIRIGCLKVLAEVRRMSSVRQVAPLIEDPEKKVRLQAIQTISDLSQVWKQRSIELLSAAMEDEDAECVKKAAKGLSDMRYVDATEALREKFQNNPGVQSIYAARFLYEHRPSEQYADRLLQALLSNRPARRKAALESIKELKDQIIEPLVEFADENAGERRVQDLLAEVRDSLIQELNEILDTKRAGRILDALGAVADAPSVEKLAKDMRDTRLESTWRVAATRGLGRAGLNPRTKPAQKTEIIRVLSDTLADEGVKHAVRIGAAISLCRLRQRNGVAYLLDQLDKFQEIVGEGAKISEAELESLTELRIRAQEALTQSGDFVVEFLRRRVRKEGAGPIILWAAAKTFGELGVEDTVPFLGELLRKRRKPEIGVGQEGKLSREIQLENWKNPDEETVREIAEKLEIYQYPHFIRWTAAVALGRIGGPKAAALLQETAGAEKSFLERLSKNRRVVDYHLRAPVIEELKGRHGDVLFYIQVARDEMGTGVAQSTGS